MILGLELLLERVRRQFFEHKFQNMLLQELKPNNPIIPINSSHDRFFSFTVPIKVQPPLIS